MRQLVYQHNLGTALQGGVEVEFAQSDVSVLHRFHGQHFQAIEQGKGVGTRVRLNVAHYHIDALILDMMSLGEHGEGLSHAGGVPEEHFEPGRAPRSAPPHPLPLPPGFAAGWHRGRRGRRRSPISLELPPRHLPFRVVPTAPLHPSTPHPSAASHSLSVSLRFSPSAPSSTYSSTPSSMRFTFSTFTRASPIMPNRGYSVH